MSGTSSEKYCLVIPFKNGNDDSYQKICKDFLSELKIPLIQYRVDGEREAFGGIEDELMGAIAEFLEKINKYT